MTNGDNAPRSGGHLSQHVIVLISNLALHEVVGAFTQMMFAVANGPTPTLADLVDGSGFHETLNLQSKWRSVGAVRRTAAMSCGQRIP